MSPPRTDRFTATLVLVFALLATAILVFYPYFSREFSRLVGYVGAVLYWPLSWPGSYSIANGPPLVYDYIFPMYIALIAGWLIARALNHRDTPLPSRSRRLIAALILVYVFVELVTDALFFTIPGREVRSVSLLVRATLGAMFLTLILYAMFTLPTPLREVTTRFPRDRRAIGTFFLVGLVSVGVSGVLLYYLTRSVPLGPAFPYFTILLLLPALALPIFAAIMRPVYFAWERSSRRRTSEPYLPSVTILIPAYNEQAEIQDAIEAADRAAGRYEGRVSIVIANDGSTDRTSQIAREAVRRLQHSVGVVLDLPHQGKSGALNQGLRFAPGEIILRCDADARLSQHTGFGPAVALFRDPEVGGVQGQIWPRQKEGWTRKLRAMEIAWQHLFLRPGAMAARSGEVLDGAFTLFRRRDLLALGGWIAWNGEDTELSIRLQRQGFRVAIALGALAFEDVPTDYRTLRKQRIRWTRGGVFANARNYPALLGSTPEYAGLGILFYFVLALHAGARGLVYLYLALVTIFLGVPGLLHAAYLIAALVVVRTTPLAYFLTRMRRYDALVWIPMWPVLGMLKSIFRFEALGSILFGAPQEFY